MTRRSDRHRCALAALLILVVSASAGAAPPVGPGAEEWEIELSHRLADLRIDDGQIRVETPEGEVVVPPEAFVREIERRQRDRRQVAQGRSRLYRVLDITSPLGVLWVVVGFLGQFLFTGRMIVQWLVSEKAKRSVVPPVFWWMSLTGASMLLAYFIWRQDIVGVFGQVTGWLIYVRNLWLLYRPKRGPQTANRPAGNC